MLEALHLDKIPPKRLRFPTHETALRPKIHTTKTYYENTILVS